ncbi:hypothetical protein J6590_005254 [Homalodisca vitripennis]|nr:hypothetical protein J6590_005254 [Homalodisca vitripennis]
MLKLSPVVPDLTGRCNISPGLLSAHGSLLWTIYPMTKLSITFVSWGKVTMSKLPSAVSDLTGRRNISPGLLNSQIVIVDHLPDDETVNNFCKLRESYDVKIAASCPKLGWQMLYQSWPALSSRIVIVDHLPDGEPVNNFWMRLAPLRPLRVKGSQLPLERQVLVPKAVRISPPSQHRVLIVTTLLLCSLEPSTRLFSC